MLRPTSFAIHMTYACPLSCAHCCFSSNPKNTDRLSAKTIIGSIRRLNRDDISLVAFTGGEPFLLGETLVSAVREASKMGFTTRIVTSAYFGKHKQNALKRLTALKEAGLDELSISWDDYHERFVEFECIANVYGLAKSLGISTAINIVQSAQSSWTESRIRKELGLPVDSDDTICESPLNLNGRAMIDLTEAGRRQERFLGPCPYVLTGPTLSAKKKLLACCGVIPETGELTIDDDYSPENLDERIDAASRSPLLNWLYLRGPYAVMEYIGEKYDLQIPEKSMIGGNCEACRHLFGDDVFKRHIHAATQTKSSKIFSELDMLELLGLLKPQHVLGLWHAPGPLLDTTRFQKPETDGTSDGRKTSIHPHSMSQEVK